MERHVNARQRNGSEASLELNMSLRFLLLLSLFEARLDDLAEHLLYLLGDDLLRELMKGVCA